MGQRLIPVNRRIQGRDFMKTPSKLLLCLFAALSSATAAIGAEKPTSASVYALTDSGVGEPIGTVTFTQSKSGLVLTTKLTGLAPGIHGIHIHQTADCSATVKDGKPVPGGSAGGHFDPDQTGKHLGPNGAGHKGDLPFLKVTAKGDAKEKLLAPHLTLADVKGHSLMIHAGGDNYSDDPAPLGGGGARVACGVIE
jgi:Cu-Zn family superoxide dismutase